MRAELISVGTEILLGEILDTNAQYIASRLPAIGIDLYHQTTVGDNLERLTEAIERALARSDVIIMTGGLGPTEDDLTREAIAEVLGEEMFVDTEAEQRLRAFFTARGVAFPERNVKQTMLIPSATAIPNPRGTAPGWWVEKNTSTDDPEDTKHIIAMPGPPAEMQRMWEEEVEPKLIKLAGAGVLVSRVLKTIGVGESHIDEMVAPLLSSTNPTIGVYAKPDGVYLRLAAKADSEEHAWVLIAPVEEEARRILGAVIWGADNDTLEGVVGQMLDQHGLTLATMESCTSGLLASTITDVPGAARYHKGGYVATSKQMLMGLGVSADIIETHGLISPEAAEAMAAAARRDLDASYGIAITGNADDTETEGKPPGAIHIAVAGELGPADTISYTFYQGRQATKRRAVTTALFLLRRTLLARDA
jgi:competence/damage-inducible protein CinA-like protein